MQNILNIDKLKFDDKGLIPAIIIDYYTKEVLTLAYMNKESLDISLKEGKTCFYSRSRKELWRKGETSKNYQHIQSIKSDCDNDALVIEVIKDGPACHTGAESCFMNEIYEKENYKDFSIYKLYELIRGRKINMTEGSYTTYLFNSGIDKILKKIGEESSEVIIGAKNGSKEEIIYELSDLFYHSLVLMVEKNITLNAFNYIYGSGGLTSKLYKSIREENSLCYAINSMYLKYDGLLMVQISLDQCNVKKAISLVKKELKKMQNGEFSDMELNDAINNMIISLDMSLDNNVAILNNYVFNIYDNLPLIEKRKEYFKEINKNDIINVSKKIKLNTIFTLEGKDS